MRRILYDDLVKWKSQKIRKPLLLHGARQVGKSYLLQEFGRLNFPKVHIFNFDKEKKIHSLFSQDLDPKEIIANLSFYRETNIQNEDLIFFDEIQECPRALNSLKYFCEDMPVQAVCAAGSLLGVKFSPESAPVGKVDIYHLYPMSFKEFLKATNLTQVIDAFNNAEKGEKIPEMAHKSLLKLLYQYLITGGLPEVVKKFIDMKSDVKGAYFECRKLQNDIITMYKNDFAKHSGKLNSLHITDVFENIPSQLASNLDGSTKKYKFKGVIPGKKSYAELSSPLVWLEKAGLIHKVKICNKSEIPFESFTRDNIFKCFLFDVGILGAMLDLNPLNIIDNNYGMTKGYFAENFIACELKSCGVNKLYSWSEGSSEIEFLLSHIKKIIPLEVKAGNRTQAKSLKQYISKYKPEEAIIFSLKKFQTTSKNINYFPLYLCSRLCAKEYL